MDRVSDETLKEMLERAEQKYCFDDPLIAALRELESLRKQQEWIPCEVREPERGGRYQVVYQTKRQTPRFYIGDFIPREGWCSVLQDTKITHWREFGPLPASPEKKEVERG